MLVAYAPAVLGVVLAGGGLLLVWVAFTAVFMGARFVVLLTAPAAPPGWSPGSPAGRRSGPYSDAMRALQAIGMGLLIVLVRGRRPPTCCPTRSAGC